MCSVEFVASCGPTASSFTPRGMRNRFARGYFRGRTLSLSLYEPETMVRALELSGFRPEFAGFGPGHAEIIKFKVLKNLGIRRISSIQGLIPWGPLSRLVDLKYGVTAHPIAWANGP